jgi:hypothetical protein
MKPPASSPIFRPRSLAVKIGSKRWLPRRIRAAELERQAREQAEHEEALTDRERIEEANGKKMKSRPPERPKKGTRAQAQLNLTSVGGALAELEAAGRRSGDVVLAAAMRRTRWQMGRLEQRCAAAEAKAATDAATVETLRRQRDRLGAEMSVSAVGKLEARIDAQAAEPGRSSPNYGDRWRNGEAISTAFVESAVNQIVSRRFVRKQQMRWTERGSHDLLRIRTRVLNEEWRCDGGALESRNERCGLI